MKIKSLSLIFPILIILLIIIVFTKDNDTISVVFPITNVDQMGEIRENDAFGYNQIDNKLEDFDVLNYDSCSNSYELKFEEKINLNNIYLISEDGENIPVEIYYDYDYIFVCNYTTIKPSIIYLPTAHGEGYYINVNIEN